MNERDDYLFDPAATPDPELAALERALAPLRHRAAPWRGELPAADAAPSDSPASTGSPVSPAGSASAPPVSPPRSAAAAAASGPDVAPASALFPPPLSSPSPGSPAASGPAPLRSRSAALARRRGPVVLVAAAALLLVALGMWAAWPRARGDELRPHAAARTFVAAATAGPRTVALGDLATLTLQPGAELDFVHWRADQALFALRHGALSVRVAPPPVVAPGFFQLDTPLGRVIDQGCAYELEVRDGGAVHVRVREGAIAFAAAGRSVFVPAGASTAAGAQGPATPCFDDAEPELRKAAREYDLLRARGADLDERGRTVKQVLAAARTPRDSLVVWHLLRDPEELFRTPARDHLFDLVEPLGVAKDQLDDPEAWLSHLRLAAWQ